MVKAAVAAMGKAATVSAPMTTAMPAASLRGRCARCHQQAGKTQKSRNHKVFVHHRETSPWMIGTASGIKLTGFLPLL
jgi:hypothetical protein